MNRAMKRKMDKGVKRKLTPEQYKDFTSQATIEYVKEETDRLSQKVIGDIIDLLPVVLRKNRISEERVEKILTEFVGEFNSKHAEVMTVEGLSE